MHESCTQDCHSPLISLVTLTFPSRGVTRRGWHEENRRLITGAVRRQHSSDTIASGAPTMKQSAEEVFTEVDARLEAAKRSITQSELGN